MLRLMLWIVCFIIFRCILSCFSIYYGCVFCFLSGFFVKFCLFSLFNLCVVSINLCIVFFWFVIGGIFSFLIYFSLCCDFPPNFVFLLVMFFLKSWSLLLVFLCVVGFALFQLEIHLMLWILMNTLRTWRRSLPFFLWWFC